MKTEILMEMEKRAKGGGEERQIVKFEEQKGEKNEQRSGKEMRVVILLTEKYTQKRGLSSIISP